MAIRDEEGTLRGFARVVRDFTDRHERDEKLRRSQARLRPVPMRPAPTKPTWMGLPCSARRSNACLNISLPLSLF